MLTGHAVQRVVHRVNEAGADMRQVVATAVSAAKAAKAGEAVAVRVATLPAQVGQAWGQQSNGDQVWAIVRDRRVVTMMLRRSTQPATAAAMRVNRVQVAA